MHDSKTLRLLVGTTAVLIAICSAAFSVYGLSLIFAGIAVAIMIMASVIELGKVVAVAFLYQRWKTINWAFRFILGIMILAGMAVTSAGIFGILSSGYEKAAVELNTQSNQILLLNNKKAFFSSQIKNLESQKTFYEQRAIQLSTLRKNQEQRLDNIYLNEKRSAKSTENLIKQTNIDIDSANKRSDRIITKVSQLNDSIQNIDEKIQAVTLINNRVGLDPLKYLSRIIEKSADNFVKWFIALLISIFDPMAIMLLMAFNQMNLDKNKSNSEIENKDNTNIFRKVFSKLVNNKKKIEEVTNKVTQEIIIPEKENISNNESQQNNISEKLNKNNYITEVKDEKIEIKESIITEPSELIEKETMNTTNKMEIDNQIENDPIEIISKEIEVTNPIPPTVENNAPTTRMQADGGMVPN